MHEQWKRFSAWRSESIRRSRPRRTAADGELVVLVLSLVFIAIAATGQAQAPARTQRQASIPGAPRGITAFLDVTVIPMDTDRVLPHQTVLIQGGRVAAIEPTATAVVPKGTVRIEGRGQYLMPGFGTCHGHFGFRDNFGFRDSENRKWDQRGAEIQLFQLFAGGITVLRSMDYMDADAKITPSFMPLDGVELLRLRTRAEAGALWSPRMYTTGQWAPKQYILSRHPHSWEQTMRSAWPADYSDAWQMPVPRMDSVAAYVAAFKAAGYDYLKLHEESPEMADSVFAAARRVGIQVVGHVVGTFEQALAGGQRVTEHWYGWPRMPREVDATAYQTTAHDMAARAGVRWHAGMWSCIGGNEGSTEGGDSLLLRAAADSGGLLLSGGDGGPSVGEVRHFVHIGLTPYQALAIETKNYGRYFRTLKPHDGEVGTIAVGQRADLVLLTGNPLADIRYADFRFGEDTVANPVVVMVGGRWLARPELNRRLAVLEQFQRLRYTLSALRDSLRADTLVPARRDPARVARDSLPAPLQSVLARLDAKHQAERFALLSRFALARMAPAGGADSLRGPQRLIELFARQLSELRAVVPTARQPRFDVVARAWLDGCEAEGYHSRIAGIH